MEGGREGGREGKGRGRGREGKGINFMESILDLEKIFKIFGLREKMTRCIGRYKVPLYFPYKKISKTSIPSEEGIEVLEKN